MKDIYVNNLYAKNILVSNSENTDNYFEVLYALADLFGVKIVKGEKLANVALISFLEKRMWIEVPRPFYKGFPDSVRNLSENELLFDQMYNYFRTYGCGDFEETRHSIFEDDKERSVFNENVKLKEYSIVDIKEAEKLVREMVDNLLSSSRPLSVSQIQLIQDYVKDFDYKPLHCESKNTAVKLLYRTQNLWFASFLNMSDVIKLVEEINISEYNNGNIKKLNLKNKDRKFIIKVMNQIFKNGKCDIINCYEKKAIWNGLLYHIHYKPVDSKAEKFVLAMQNKGNESIYSKFEKAIAENNVTLAADILLEGKGQGTLLRNLNYLLSRCQKNEDIDYIISKITTKNIILLIQLLIKYASDNCDKTPRDFIFTKNNMISVHRESEDELNKRKSFITKEISDKVSARINNNIKEILKGRINKIYINPDMKRIALPIQETASQGGARILSKGSRIPIEKGKKIRAFTYWEKVNDIDLSIIALTDTGEQIEFSWRTMYDKQSEAIVYSGDETSGYNGGSEYFDIDVEEVKKLYPEIEYLILCDNVFSKINFNECICNAGYMLRDKTDSGEIYEPKTVESSYTINCSSTFAYLFAIDLKSNEFVWLNIAREGETIVAGTSSLDFLRKTINVTSVINVYSFFEMLANEIVENPLEADLVVTDEVLELPDDKEIIRSMDFEKMLTYMN